MMTRRAILQAAAASGAVSALGQVPRAESYFAYTGCYTTAQRYGRGDGIHVYRIDGESGAWTHLQHVPNLVNPSFLALHPDGRKLYSVHGDQTFASSFRLNPETGMLTPLNRVETGGRNGVHLAVHPSGRFLVLANYSSGGVTVLGIRDDGSLGEPPVQVCAMPGQPGPHRIEQASSHPHQVAFDPAARFVMVPDKGLDRVFVFAVDPATGKLAPTAQGAAVAKSGSGPRHGAFHPALPVVWVLNEIQSTVTTYYWEAERGHLRAVEWLPTVPSDYTGENTASEIAVSKDARFVYCSNRGHDSVAVFAADPATGLLKPAGSVSSQGRTPRFIGIDPAGRVLYCANEQSDTVIAYRMNSSTGALTPTGQVIRTGSPVTIVFVRRDVSS